MEKFWFHVTCGEAPERRRKSASLLHKHKGSVVYCDCFRASSCSIYERKSLCFYRICNQMGTAEEWIVQAQQQAQAHPAAVATTLVFLVVNAVILIWYHHPLYGKNIGPVVFPIVGTLPSIVKNGHRFLDYTVELILQSPTQTMRFVRPGGVVAYNTANVENVEYILKTRFENFVKGEYLGEVLDDLLGKGIFNVDGNLWKLQRKLASHEFTSRSLREFGFECAEKELNGRLVPILKQVSENDAIIDLQDLFLRFAFDNICQLGFGVDPNCLEPSLPTVRFAEAFDTANELTVKRFRMLPVIRKLRNVSNLGTEKELREKVKVVNEFAQGVIQARRKEFTSNGGSMTSRQDLLSRFMRFTDLSDNDTQPQSELEQKCIHDLKLDSPQPLEKEQAMDVFLRDIIISFVLAGRDTSSAGLSWFFQTLSQNPRVEAKLYDEIRNHAPNPKTTETLFSFEDLKKLQYLTAAIHESLRLFPPVPMDTKEAVRDDVLPDGTMVRKGQRVTYNVYAMARMPNIWGEDCYEFKPERWLKDGVFVQESAFKFAVFQAGPRICLGKELALTQMKLIAASLIYHFEFSVVEKHPSKAYRSIVFRMASGLPVRVRPRG